MRSVSTVLILTGLALAQAPVTKYGVPIEAGPMDTILLKDYQPESSLVVPRVKFPKAHFPAIDVHTHDFMGGDIKTAADVAAWVKTMDAVGIQTSIVFIEAVGPEFDKQAKLFLAYPGRFQVWCGLDTKDFDQPGYGERAAAELERCYRVGARGIGELSDKGWGFQKEKLPMDKRLHLDDPRLDPVWRKCAQLRIPANIHVADHPSCWRPLGPNQERTADFQVFNLYGKDVPSYQELLARRDQLLERNPKTTFIFCHFSNQGNDFGALSKALDRFPNLYLDLSARDYEIGREPRAATRFLTRYSDRVMFGTDMGRDQAMYEGWWELLESDNEYIPGRMWWRQYGLALPAPMLEKLYRTNAKRLLNWQ